MEARKMHIRNFILLFNLDHNTLEIKELICEAYEVNSVGISMVKVWHKVWR